MPSRRDLIKLTDAERLELLESERVVTITTNGPRGWPHAMPMWYLPRDGEVWIWTYGKSQKVRNLERDPKATLLLETGELYHELRGVMIEAEAVIHRDQETILGFGREMTARYSGGLAEGEGEAVLQAQAAKRVALQFVPRRTASWDHRKLGTTY